MPKLIVTDEEKTKIEKLKDKLTSLKTPAIFVAACAAAAGASYFGARQGVAATAVDIYFRTSEEMDRYLEDIPTED